MHAPPKECLYLAIKLLQVFKSYFINLYTLHSSVSHNKCNRHHDIDKSIVAYSSLTPSAGKGNMLTKWQQKIQEFHRGEARTCHVACPRSMYVGVRTCLNIKLVVNKPQNLTFPRKIKNR